MLLDKKLLSSQQLDQIRQRAVAAVKQARTFCVNEVDDKLVTKDELWPKPESITIGVRSDGSEFKDVTFQEIEDFSELETRTYVESIAAVTGRHLEKNEDVFVMGEEVANFGGGPYGATKGLPQIYPTRILNTPISECGFSGLGGGAAMSGLKPIIEIMFPDFALVAADQLFNQIGKLRHMYGNSTDMPIVVRTRIAIGCGYGGQHSMDPVGIFSLFSGWHIIAPSNAFDYIGLFNSAMQCKDPVLVIEHHALYPKKSESPRGNLDYFVKMGQAKVVNTGSDITVLTYGISVPLVQEAVAALANEGVSVEVIDLRTLSLPDIDYETIGKSLQKTNVMAVVEQAPASMAIGPRIAYECQKQFFDYLDAPIATVSGLDIPNPVSRKLEAAAVPNVDSVRNMVLDLVKRKL
jgi:2-oxoisovalerate dehydrogenase E1 component